MKRRKLIWIVAAVACLAVGWGIFGRGDGRKDGVEVRTVRVERGNIEQTLLTTGVVEPQNRVEIKPPIGGRIEDVVVREGDRIRKGDIVAWMSSTERAALLDAARMKGAGEVARWSELYKPAPLVAPIDGTVIARNVESGQSVTTADAVIVMSDRLIVKAQVDETDIGMAKIGQTAVVTLDAYPRDPIAGIVDHIAYEAQTVNNVTVYGVDVLPVEVPAFMRSGMTANVTFRIAFRENVLWVPAESVKSEDGEKWVMAPNPSGKKPVRREVRTGLTDGKRIEVLEGLADGDEVLVARSRMIENKRQEASSPFTPFGRGRSSSKSR
ncbi:efflux RND transporter periplasmic adaptor subunit [bacterium]|nr:efflux RND transporter periplasmic adaptor subunit [bacterium]